MDKQVREKAWDFVFSMRRNEVIGERTKLCRNCSCGAKFVVDVEIGISALRYPLICGRSGDRRRGGRPIRDHVKSISYEMEGGV